MDWETWQPIDEILLMSGCSIPTSRQVPLLDTHDRSSTGSVIGSCRNLQVAGTELIGRAFFADDPAGGSDQEIEAVWVKVRDGHITDFSVGYTIDLAILVPDGQSTSINGRQYDGPVRVVTDWTLKELSVCPIGADAAAKARAEATAHKPMARAVPEPQKKDAAMDKRLLAFLESRGLPKDATEDAAWEFFRKLEDPPPAQNIDEQVRTEISKERERFAEITAMGHRFDCPEMAVEMIRSGETIDSARIKVLDHLAKKQKEEPTPGFRAAIGTDERDKFRTAAEDALCLRSGMKIEKAAPGASDLMGYSLREMARHSLMLANQNTGGSVMEMLGRSLVTGDLPNVLANVANKFLFSGYETAPETWRTWCEIGSVSDFKTNSLVSISESSDLDQISEGQKYNYGDRSDAKETYAIATYGKLFAITRQTLINDDLGALTEVPRQHGEAAARKVGDIAYAVLTANSAMRDGIALFHASHGNLGTSGVISETTIAEAIKLMKLQKDLAGLRRLNIRAEYFIGPAAIEGVTERFFNSGTFSGSNDASTRVNPYAGSRFTRVFDPRLDDTSSAVYYLAGPKGKTVKVFFLNAQQSPYLEMRQGWSVDGVEYKVRIDAGAKAVDWKAMVKNAGV